MLSDLRAAAFAETLGIELFSSGVCLPCLTFIAFPLDRGDEREARRQLRSFSRDLWEDGLELTTMVALEDAKRRGDPVAGEAIRDIEISGPDAAIVRAIVWRLAHQMVADMRGTEVVSK